MAPTLLTWLPDTSRLNSVPLEARPLAISAIPGAQQQPQGLVSMALAVRVQDKTLHRQALTSKFVWFDPMHQQIAAGPHLTDAA
jgi:hypothetical protein